VATFALTEVPDVSAYGAVRLDGGGRVVEFQEKSARRASGLISAGSYVLRRTVIEAVPADRPAAMETDVLPGLLAAGATVLGHLDRGYWIDMGTPASYLRACQDAAAGRLPGWADGTPPAVRRH
jgi:mannose-1-phosphate guanylyltransferase